MASRLKKFFYENLEEKGFIHSRSMSIISWILSFTMLVGMWFLSEHFFYDRAQKRFENYTSNHFDILQNRLHQYEITLRGGVGFFHGSNEVTRTDWHHFVASMDPKVHNPGMQGIGYTMMISPENVAIIEEKIRREGYTSFEIKPKGKRELYSAILYLEPLDKRNLAAIGYDMYSEPIRRDAMERAAKSGEMSLSGRVTLVQEIDQDIQAGVLIYLPYYINQEELDTAEERQRSLEGYVYAPLRMSDFINSITSHKENLYLEIYDGEGKRDDNLLYKSPEISGYSSDHHLSRTLNIGGRVWHITYSSAPAFDARHNTQYPILLALAGLIVYLILMYIILELLKKRSLLKIKTEALKHEKELAQEYLDIVDVMVLVLDTDNTIRVINRRGCEIIGYTPQEAIGKNFVDLFIPERMRQLLAEIAKNVVEYDGYKYYENPIITKSGDERLIAWRNTLLRNEDGSVIGILSSGEDITDIRRTQELLQESEAFYRTIFGSIEEAIVILNDNRIVDCNNVALKLFDTSKELFVGHSIFDAAHEIECQNHPLQHYLETAYRGEFTTALCTLRLHTNPSIVKIVEFSFSRFGSSEENKLVIIARDITRKVAEEKLLTIHGRQAQMGEMISMIAHQWRQPLAIINAITTQIRFKAIMNDTEDHELIDNLVKIEQQSAHLSQTISDYRDFFRPDKPKEHFRIVSLIDHAINLIDHTLKSHSIRIEKEHVYNPTLYTYRNEVLQVLIVLLKNALDAFVENKVVGGEIIINVRQEEKYCVIEIQDNAGGIPKEIMYKLFSPYFTTKNESFGTGLGLYMSRIIIEDHCSGLIQALSEGNTTVFSVKLPYEEEQ